MIRFLIMGFMLLASAAQGAVLKVGPDKPYKMPSEAAARAKNNSVIEIDAGVYAGDVAVWRQHNLTIRGMGGMAHIMADGRSAEGKGTWIIKGNNATIENIEFSGSRVPDRNGAGVRLEGTGLTVRKCYFHDNENGILTGSDPDSDILIERSEFARNGHGDGYSHNVYIGGVRTFTLRFSYSHHAKVGHQVKSRAAINYILYNRLMDERDGSASYIIDIPEGGRAFLIGNLVQQGRETENYTLVSFGAEGADAGQSELHVVNNTFVNDFDSGRFIAVAAGIPPAVVINNIFLGSGTVITGASRMKANLVSANARLVDRAGFDYRPAPGSPAIDAGISPGVAGNFDLTPRYHYRHPAGSEPRAITGPIDIGAYEFGSPADR